MRHTKYLKTIGYDRGYGLCQVCGEFNGIGCKCRNDCGWMDGKKNLWRPKDEEES